MEVVVFDRKEYTKASVLAKRFRYTADYLGQLCRGKKVDARLVGRAWYINLDSLNQHRDGRYKPAASAKTTAEEPLNLTKRNRSNYLSRIDVEPILKKKTVSIFKSHNGTVTKLSVKYENDDHSLIPRVNKDAISKNIVIKPAGAEKIKVHKQEAAYTDFRAEPLPEVFLKGTLKVAGLDEAIESLSDQDLKKDLEIKSGRIDENEISTELVSAKVAVRPLLLKVRTKNTSLSALQRKPSIPVAIKEATTIPTTEPLRARVIPAINSAEMTHKISLPTHGGSGSLLIKQISTAREGPVPAKLDPDTFKPFSVLKKESRQKIKNKNTTPVGWWKPTILFVLALLFVGLSFGSALEINVTKKTSHTRVVISKDIISTYFATFKQQ